MQLTMRDGRPTTIATGAHNEDRAVEFLESHGYVVVERNFKTKLGEIDVIARDGDTLVFVEVRSRTNDHFGNAVESVNANKRRRVSRMALLYLTWRKPAFGACRFDVVGITGDRIDHIVDAWRL